MNMKKKTSKINKQSIIDRIKGFELEDPRTVEPKVYPQPCRHLHKNYVLQKSQMTKLNLKMVVKCEGCDTILDSIPPRSWKLYYYKFFENPIKWALHTIKTEEPLWPSIVAKKQYLI